MGVTRCVKGKKRPAVKARKARFVCWRCGLLGRKKGKLSERLAT